MYGMVYSGPSYFSSINCKQMILYSKKIYNSKMSQWENREDNRHVRVLADITNKPRFLMQQRQIRLLQMREMRVGTILTKR